MATNWGIYIYSEAIGALFTTGVLSYLRQFQSPKGARKSLKSVCMDTDTWQTRNTDRAQVPWCDDELVYCVSRDAEHGGEGKDPANELAPPGVHVVDVLQRPILHQAEHEHSLHVQFIKIWAAPSLISNR